MKLVDEHIYTYTIILQSWGSGHILSIQQTEAQNPILIEKPSQFGKDSILMHIIRNH